MSAGSTSMIKPGDKNDSINKPIYDEDFKAQWNFLLNTYVTFNQRIPISVHFQHPNSLDVFPYRSTGGQRNAFTVCTSKDTITKSRRGGNIEHLNTRQVRKAQLVAWRATEELTLHMRTENLVQLLTQSHRQMLY